MRKVKTIQKVPFLAPDVQTKIVPAPTDGWDAISPLAEMDPKRAPILDNWVPRPGYVELRAGYTPQNFIAGGDPVETLLVYRSPSSEELFAASGGSIYDVSSYAQADVVLTGLNSARWQYVTFTPAGGTAVIQLVNGTDTLKQYNGSAWSTPSITGFPGGGTTANIININAQKRRLWYILANSTIAAFMPTDAISGAIAGYIDLGAQFTKGGYLVAMVGWTLDGGQGPNDYAAFISSRGQVTLYAGTDPTAAETWSIVGTFDLSPPVSRRCTLRVGSDIAIITEQGVIPISQALPFDPSADRSVAITARIQNAMAQAVANGRHMFGWQLISYPDQQLAILNVPIAENTQQVQYVMNALTGAWCRFTGWNFNCFEIYNDDLYAGDNNGFVNKAYDGGTDGGSPIAIDMQCAFNWFEQPGRVKHMTMVQPLLTIDGTVFPTIQVDQDFSTSTQVSPISYTPGGAQWDTALWDVATWPSGTNTFTYWLTVNAVGHALAIRLKANILTTGSSLLSVFDTAEFDFSDFDGGSSGAPGVLQVNAFNTILEMGGAI